MASNPYALNLTGGSVTLPSTLQTSGDLTVMFQFNMSTISQTAYQFFFTYGFGSGWGLRMYMYSNKFYVDAVVGGSTYTATSTANLVNTNQYYRLAAVFKNGSYLTLYLNGTQIASTSFSSTSLRHSGSSVIGGNTASGSIGEVMSGYMDEISIWNRALSVSDIQWYSGTLKGNESGLIAYYRCDEGSGTTLLDATSNAYNGNLSGTGASWTATSPVIYTKKYLIQDGSNIATTNGTTLTTVGTAPVTQSMFDNYGQTDSTLLTGSSVTSSVSTNPQVLVWTDAPTNAYSPTATVVEVPKGRVVSQNSDYSLTSYQSVTSFNLTANTSGSGVVKVAVSVDKGVTWKTWDSTNSVWANIDITNTTTMKSSGMTSAVLNARTATDISNLIGSSTTLRFAYYLEQNASSDTANADTLAIVVTMKGSWDAATLNTDFKYGYPLNNDLRVTIYTSGDYKINYQG